jgi:hypothetical protein
MDHGSRRPDSGCRNVETRLWRPTPARGSVHRRLKRQIRGHQDRKAGQRRVASPRRLRRKDVFGRDSGLEAMDRDDLHPRIHSHTKCVGGMLKNQKWASVERGERGNMPVAADQHHASLHQRLWDHSWGNGGGRSVVARGGRGKSGH